MFNVMDNGIEVFYTWKTIDLEEHEQYGHEVKKPLFDLNEDCEVFSPPRRVLRPYSTLETQEMTLVEVDSFMKKFAKSLVLKGS
jgi:hypothetical protein